MEPVSANAPPIYRPPLMTFAFIAINVTVFAIMIWHDYASSGHLSPRLSLETLLRFGAKQNGLIAVGEIERTVIPMFLHADLLHLAVNMYALYFLGRFLEFQCGARVLALVYFAAGLTGNLCSFALLSPLSDWSSPLQALLFSKGNSGGGGLLSVGASSSIFGIIGYLYAWERYQIWLARRHRLRVRATTNLGPILIINVIITFTIPFIDWASHLGGAIGGAIVGGGSIFRAFRDFRITCMLPYASARSALPPAKIWQRDAAWWVVLVLVNSLFALRAVWINPNEIILGRGLEEAIAEPIQPKDLRLIREFESALVGDRAVTDPIHLLHVAVGFHINNQHIAAMQIYRTVALLRMNGLDMSTTALQEIDDFIVRAFAAARTSQPLPPSLIALFPQPLEVDLDDCIKPSHVFSNLGFFIPAAWLAECAASLAPENSDLGVRVVMNYWRAHNVADMITFLKQGPGILSVQGQNSNF